MLAEDEVEEGRSRSATEGRTRCRRHRRGKIRDDGGGGGRRAAEEGRK